MSETRFSLILAAGLIAACVSQTTVETNPVTDPAASSARRKSEVHTALAAEYYSRGNHVIALQETQRAIREDSNYAPAHNMQALIYMELREDQSAREAFDRSLRLEPNSPEALNNYGWFLCLRNEYPRAMELLTRAVNDPLYATPEKAYLSAGLCLRRAGRSAEAENHLRRAVAIRPDLIGALYNLAEINFERGDFVEAEKYLNRFMRVSNPTLEALVMGYKISRAKGDRVAQDSYAQQLRRRFPDAPQTREVLEGPPPAGRP